MFLIRTATTADLPAVLVLNAEWEHFTSALDGSSLASLHAQAAYHRVVVSDGRVVAFLLALREGADYDSPNYRWFADTGRPFLYVDRIVVSRAEQGRGLGEALYDDIFEFALAEGVERIVCEVDVDPPNAASIRFHDRFGFREVGTQLVGGGSKRVSLREAPVPG
jgi:predicted GNAT superfamily acetyltransferase